MISPPGAPQLVSSTIVPGRYRRAAGTATPSGPSRNMPAPRSRMAPNTLGESNRGRHSHATFPLGATSAHVWQADKNAYSAIGGNGLAPEPPPVRRSTTERVADPAAENQSIAPRRRDWDGQ